MTAVYSLTINSNGQITIPSKFRKLKGLKPNSKVKMIIKNDLINFEKEDDYTLEDLPKIVKTKRVVSQKDLEKALKDSFKTTSF